jgi:hypothetical protein
VGWEAFRAGLTPQDLQRAERIAAEHGLEAASRYLRYHPARSPDELAAGLQRDRRRVRTQVRGLYESIDVNQCPVGWTMTNDRQREPDGTLVIRTDVTGPNGARGFFVRGFNAVQQRIELREAFLRHDGMTEELPKFVTGMGVEMLPGRGTPTHLYFTLYQFKGLRVPAGQVRWWRHLLHRCGLRSGPFAGRGVATSIRMFTIWNLETILHLHWLRQRYPSAEASELIAHTESVRYAEDYAIQCGYRVVKVSYVAADEREIEIDGIMKEFEGENAQRQNEHDRMLARYSFDRQTVMKQNFDIELSVVPVEVE